MINPKNLKIGQKVYFDAGSGKVVFKNNEIVLVRWQIYGDERVFYSDCRINEKMNCYFLTKKDLNEQKIKELKKEIIEIKKGNKNLKQNLKSSIKINLRNIGDKEKEILQLEKLCQTL